jgi:hypothetical protein
LLTATGFVPIEAGAEAAAQTCSPDNAPALSGETLSGKALFGKDLHASRTTSADAPGQASRLPFVQKYSPDQPRAPAGNPDGGQWTSGGGESTNSRVISDATPDNAWVPGAQYAGGIEEGEGENRIGGEPVEATPAQQARLAVTEARWQKAISQVQALDPNWKPTPGLYETVEGQITNLEAQTQEARNRLAEVTGVGAEPVSSGGHHYVPRALFENEQLQPNTMEVFEDASSGPLDDNSVNFWTTEHRAYNDAVKAAFLDFLTQNGITSEEMSPNQAREFISQLINSSDPQIRDFNMKILEQRLRYLLRNPIGR